MLQLSTDVIVEVHICWRRAGGWTTRYERANKKVRTESERPSNILPKVKVIREISHAKVQAR